MFSTAFPFTLTHSYLHSKHNRHMLFTMTKTVEEYIQEITSKGGKARAETLSAKRRKEIARKAAKARWAKARERKGGL